MCFIRGFAAKAKAHSPPHSRENPTAPGLGSDPPPANPKENKFHSSSLGNKYSFVGIPVPAVPTLRIAPKHMREAAVGSAPYKSAGSHRAFRLVTRTREPNTDKREQKRAQRRRRGGFGVRGCGRNPPTREEHRACEARERRVLFLGVASKDADDPDNPHQQKNSPTTRTRTRPGLAPHARARGRSDVDMSVVAVSYLCT